IQYPINQITTRQSFIKSQHETVKSFLKGLVAGLARFRTDREFGVKVLGQNLRETDPKILQETYDFWLKVFPKVPNPGPEDATVFLEFMQVKESRYWKEFVDNSLMEELDREGFFNSVYRYTRVGKLAPESLLEKVMIKFTYPEGSVAPKGVSPPLTAGVRTGNKGRVIRYY